MDEKNEETQYLGPPYMNLHDDRTIDTSLCGDTPLTAMDDPCADSDEESYVARRGFAVSVGDRPMPHVPFPFITISGDRIAIRVQDQIKDVLRGVQMHLSETESNYAELEITRPADIVDAVIRYAENAELAPYLNLVHTGPMPVYAMCMKDEQADPIIDELERRMKEIRAEEAELAKEPLDL